MLDSQGHPLASNVFNSDDFFTVSEARNAKVAFALEK